MTCDLRSMWLANLPPSPRDLNLRQYPTQDPEDGRVIYDLYGVINHHGGILGGHYTAFARCVDPLRPHASEHGKDERIT